MSEDAIVADPQLATTVSVPDARRGPPGMGNGGWVCGTVAAHLGAGPVEVTLRAPTPLDTPLELRVADDHASLSQGEGLLATARRSPGRLQAPAPVDWDEAVAAESGFVGHHDHPFPGCFVCGTGRAVGDGLRIFPGPVASDPGRMAAVFSPLDADAGPQGHVTPAAVWAALDCPTAWVNMAPGSVALLGRLRAEVHGELFPGREYLVVAESGGAEGRKAVGRAGIYDRDGHLLAASEAIWISPRPPTG
jgi:hypothetical protein